jgi:hypothetical protein
MDLKLLRLSRSQSTKGNFGDCCLLNGDKLDL